MTGMKRYASHFLFLPPHGYLKQQVVETEAGRVVRIFPLTEEIEDVSWLPGAIVLCGRQMMEGMADTSTALPAWFPGNRLDALSASDDAAASLPLASVRLAVEGCYPVYFPLFDITTMLPVDGGIRRRLLP